MSEASLFDQYLNDTQQILINIPYQLVVRAEKYATETKNTVTGVVIEALDALLMKALKEN